MSLIKVIAIEPCNGMHPGQGFLVSEIEARELQAAGLVKMAAAPIANKMISGPQENKSLPPSPAAGVVAPSSVSPAARVSPVQTAKQSQRGRPATRRRGK